MSVCVDKGCDDLENNENLAANGCDTRLRNNDVTDISGSQEMFSDDDHITDLAFQSPKLVAKNDTFNSSIISITTPILCTKVTEETPGRAVVPRTPADLLPFITKTSLLWTSDMETPESKLNDKAENCDKTINSLEINNTTPNRRQRTPSYENTKTDKMDITSPVLGGKKRAKRKVKRRILNNVALDLDNNNDQQSSISSNSDKVPSEASSVNNEPFFDVKPEIKSTIIEEYSRPNSQECKENKKLEEIVTFDKNSNTSTQDFFSNASFSSIDRLCCNVIPEENPDLLSKSDDKENQNSKIIKQEIVYDKEVKRNVSNDVLERVAAIKRQQKPLRRSTDISHTVIPKEVFSKSVRELELADAKFSQEKKKTQNSNIQHKPLKLISFSKLSSTENLLIVKKEKSPVRENENRYSNHDVPAEIMDDWNADNILDIKPKKENLINLSNNATSSNTNADVNFTSANGKGISINEKHLQKCMKMYNEIEKEISSNDDLLALGKSNVKSALQKQPVNHKRVLTNLLNNENNLILKSEPSSTSSDTAIGFSTASGKNIAISEDKILDYAKIYKELESENLNENSFLEIKHKNNKPKNLQLNFEKNSVSQPKPTTKIKIEEKELLTSNVKKLHEDKKSEKLKLYQELDLKEFLEPKFVDECTENINDGFTTAGGKGIRIDEEKELLYSKIYKELDDVEENSLLNSKKSKTLKVSTLEKPKNKALVIFNNKDATLNNKTTKVTARKTLESLTTEVTSDGFSTAGGKGIKICEKKEILYSKIYNELDDVDENSLLNIKKNKISKQIANDKPIDKALIVFNNKQSTLHDKNKTVISKRISEIQSTEVSSNGFSTAGGKGIKISDEKESYYSKVFNELSEDIRDENCFLNVNKKELSKAIPNKKPNNKTSIVSYQKKSESVSSIVKLSISSDTDEVFYNLGDVEELLVPANQTTSLKSKVDSKNRFTVPNSANLPKRVNQASVAPCKLIHLEEEISYTSKKPSENVLKAAEEEKIIIENTLKNKPDDSHIGKLKRKLDNCEVKRPERCRSFGGFPVKTEGVSSSKLNKSDPNNDSLVNQPLQKGLSVSQCFDLHSDSWLSKVELSYLNTSTVKSPEVKIEKIDTEDEEILGFSYKESTKSFQHYANFENWLKKQLARYKDSMEVSIESGQIISIANETLSKQKLRVQYEDSVDVRKGVNKSNYVLIKSKPKEALFKLPEKASEEEPKVKEIDNKAVEKRKHADTDSDTPLSTLKKPRVGSELQGRKLFSDESGAEENECNLENVIDGIMQSPPLQICPQLTEEEEVELADKRMDAIMQQEKIVRNKKRIKIKPVIGIMLRERLVNSKNRKSWDDFVGSSVPTARTIEQIKENHPDAKILEVTASNATCYTFLSSNFVGNKRVVSLDLEDDARLIFDKNGHAGVAEFTEAFLAMPGTDPKLLPTGWVENHYRWIVWKLASMDRIHFDSAQIPKMLTPDRVMKELKYRYDREIDRAERPALRRILEKDDVPTRRMVLCVSSIKENTNDEETDKEVKVMLGLPRWKIEVTDGWYSIPLTIDNAMANYVSTGKIKEGTKLITYGAELLECERGFFPLEKPANVSLKVYTNCTRRAKWDTKLGYQKNQRPIPVKLRNIIASGGMIGETTAVAARVYPLLYREKTPSGQSIYRNARSEEKAAIAHERALELKVDAMYAQAEKNFDSKKKSYSDEDLENSQVESKSQARIRNQNNWERKQEELKQRLESEVREGLPPPRNVSAVLKVRLVDDRATVILTIWGASEDSGYDIKEGSTITVYNSFATGTRGGELNLTANRITHIKTEPLLKLPYPIRSCTLIPDMAAMGFEPRFCEFDTVGVVVSSGPAPHGMKNFEVVNMAYPKPNNSGSSYLSILFWNGISSFGYQGIFTAGTLVACSNLEWRRNTSWNVSVAYCSEKTVFTCNPRQQYLSSVIRNLRTLVQNPAAYAESCTEEVANELFKKPQPRSSQGTPTSWSDRPSFCNTSAMISPMENYSPSNTTIQKRLEKLSRYGSSTDISPIVLNNSSVRVKKDFTPVTRKNT